MLRLLGEPIRRLKEIWWLLSPCPKALMIQCEKGFLSPRFSGRSGLFGPPLCGGSAPATPPLLQPRVVASVWAIRNCRPVSAHESPRLMADSENVPARARQARPLPYMPNLHRHDHREPATEMLTVHSPRQTVHRTWLSNCEICYRILKSVGEIRRILRAHQPELKERFHVEEIALFGFYARGDQTEASDLDILVELNAPLGWESFDLCNHLAELLETNVDVLTSGAIVRKPLLRQFVEKNLIRV